MALKLALFALDLLGLASKSKPLLLLLLEPRSRHCIRSRSSSGGTLASRTMEMCWASWHPLERGW